MSYLTISDAELKLWIATQAERERELRRQGLNPYGFPVGHFVPGPRAAACRLANMRLVADAIRAEDLPDPDQPGRLLQVTKANYQDLAASLGVSLLTPEPEDVRPVTTPAEDGTEATRARKPAKAKAVREPLADMTCRVCGTTKPENKFPTLKSGGRDDECRDCRNDRWEQQRAAKAAG